METKTPVKEGQKIPDAPLRCGKSLIDCTLTTAQAQVSMAQSFFYGLMQKVMVRALSMGPLPRHIAFIMDGNRRWSRANGMRVFEGHKMGFQALRRVLELCMSLEGIYMVTVYAFAIDNFKRSQEEVDALMELAKSRLLELYDHGEVVSRYSVRVRVVGQRHLLPSGVQDAVKRLEEATKHNTGAVLNICMPYSAQDELCHAVSGCVERGLSMTPASIDEHLMVPTDVPVDLLVRTSSVHRLSDFMLWQCNEDTQLHFVDQYWPLFGARELIPILLQYQRERLWGRSKACGTHNDLPSRQSSGR